MNALSLHEETTILLCIYNLCEHDVYCVCLYDMSWGKSDCAAPLFICTHQVTLVALQEFLSNMESHRQRGYKVLEKMRANHLQV